jgi:poly-gamma-glutamate capsule biosynthesis protein CapA/YwtB (metallophosphatase superfamily)
LPAQGTGSVDSAVTRSGFTLACVGDVMPAENALDLLHRAGSASAGRRIWQAVDGADVILANLEAPVTSSDSVHKDKRYCFKCAGEVLSVFDKRFVLSLANNHIFDYGEQGVLDTIEALDGRGLLHTGAGRNLEEAGKPVMLEVAGVRLGILCAADPRYQAATRNAAGTFPARAGILREAIRSLRVDADIVAISIHSGQEFLPVPTPRQMYLAELCLLEGVRVVSFHHSHSLSGIRRDDRGAVFFGTGNYLFPWGDTPRRFTSWQEGAVWRVGLDVCSRDIVKVEIVPILLDGDGFPCEASGAVASRILDRIARYSGRLNCGSDLRWWRLREMMNPLYLWLNLVNYTDIARRHGIRAAFRTLREGMASQLIAGRSGESDPDNGVSGQGVVDNQKR